VSPLIPTSPENIGLPVPSMIFPFVIKMSKLPSSGAVPRQLEKRKIAIEKQKTIEMKRFVIGILHLKEKSLLLLE
jgi:hypothetical protein